MKFCPDCGSIIKPQTVDEETVLDCNNCDYKEVNGEKVEFSEKSKKQNTVEVIEEDEDETKPIVEETCEECGNDQAYFWTIQTRAGDEPETRFFKCTECKNTWREY